MLCGSIAVETDRQAIAIDSVFPMSGCVFMETRFRAIAEMARGRECPGKGFSSGEERPALHSHATRELV